MTSFWYYFALALSGMAALALMFITIGLAFTAAVWLGWVVFACWAVVYAAVLAWVVTS